MIDHIGFPVSDYPRSKSFYQKALAPLGYTLIMEIAETESGSPACGLAKTASPIFGSAARAGSRASCTWRSPPTIAQRLLPRGARSRRHGQRRAGGASALSSELLRRLRARSRRAQCRGGVSLAGMSHDARASTASGREPCCDFSKMAENLSVAAPYRSIVMAMLNKTGV